jgi:hypothetical protein
VIFASIILIYTTKI